MNESLERLIETEVGKFGFQLYDWSLRPSGGRRVLHISLHSDQGVGLDDCAKVSRQLGVLIEEDELIAGRYLLEVSSPGLDRPLNRLWHYEIGIGKKVRLSHESESGEVKSLEGIIQGIEGDEVLLEIDDEVIRLKFDSISRARMVADVSMKKKG
jgi:ribosome maturation factor RimP